MFSFCGNVLLILFEFVHCLARAHFNCHFVNILSMPPKVALEWDPLQLGAVAGGTGSDGSGGGSVAVWQCGDGSGGSGTGHW